MLDPSEFLLCEYLNGALAPERATVNTSFYDRAELGKLGFGRVSADALISRNAKFYNPRNIWIGDHVRIDDFCILSAGDGAATIDLQGYNHIAAGVMLYGGAGISVGKHCQIAAQSIVLSRSDDFTGRWLNGPMVPDQFRLTTAARIVLWDFSILGARSTVMPGAELAEGAVLGAHSFTKRLIPEWQVWAGSPAKFLYHRLRTCASMMIDVRAQA